MGCCFSAPSTGSVNIITKFGKYQRTDQPGLKLVSCCTGSCVAGNVSLRLQALQVLCETKTKDNVFIHVEVSIQYQVIDPTKFFYRLTYPESQMQSYVFDVIRALVPRIELDDVFITKDEIAHAIQAQLSVPMREFGIEIVSSPVTDIDPDKHVKAAMNEIVRTDRLKQAAENEGEALRIRTVKAAEADAERIRIQAAAEAESTYLQGEGMARQRHAIISGMRKDVVEFSNDVNAISPQTVIEIVLATQYFNTMRDLGTHSNSTTVFVPSTPSAIHDLTSQIRNGFMQADALSTSKSSKQVFDNRSEL